MFREAKSFVWAEKTLAEVFEFGKEGYVVGGDADVGGGFFAVGAGDGNLEDVAFGDAAGSDVFDEGDKFGV